MRNRPLSRNQRGTAVARTDILWVRQDKGEEVGVRDGETLLQSIAMTYCFVMMNNSTIVLMMLAGSHLPRQIASHTRVRARGASDKASDGWAGRL